MNIAILKAAYKPIKMKINTRYNDIKTSLNTGKNILLSGSIT